MARDVMITGLGTLTAAGSGMAPLWDAAVEGRSALARIEAFDPSGFDARIAGEVRDFKVNKIVPKHYRKATKVMARDIELAVGAADCAVRDAGLTTPGTDPDQRRTYEGTRCGVNIGAGLIAADLDELTRAMASSFTDDNEFDIHRWGAEGMASLTPLWLLKYLPNMLACHVTIIHDAQGPSNTITCGEASSGLSIGESIRVIQRHAADMCFCGGAESKINPMAFYRQMVTGRLACDGNDNPAGAVRPFDRSASGTAIGEGGGILVVEAGDTAEPRGARIYARLLGYGAGHTVTSERNGLEPDPEGKGMVAAIGAALNDSNVQADEIDLIIPFGSAIPAFDTAEAAALKTVFGDRLSGIPLWSSKPYVGNCGAGAGGIDIAFAARCLSEQKMPARINCPQPLDGLNAAEAPSQPAKLQRVLVCSSSLGGQNTAVIVGRA